MHIYFICLSNVYMESNIEKVKKELKQRLLYPSKQDINYTSYSYTLFQANMQRFFPKLDITHFEELYKQFIYSQHLVVFDQHDLKKLDTLSIVNNSSLALLPSHLKEPTIFATFHYGSYRVINFYLLKQGFKVVLITDGPAYIKQKEKCEKLFFKYKDEILKNNSEFIILNVKEPAFIFKLKRLLLNGYVLVVYIDGNAGSLKEKNNNGRVEIDFLNSKINVKTGIPIISLLLKAFIIPVVTCWGEDEQLEMTFYKSISPNNYSDSKLYAKDTLLKLYSILEEKLLTNPAQWECWTYINKWFERDFHLPYEEIDRKKIQYKFNNKRYSLFSLKENYYFFDKFSYRAFPINENLHNLLKEEKIKKIESSILENLLSKNVII